MKESIKKPNLLCLLKASLVCCFLSISACNQDQQPLSDTSGNNMSQTPAFDNFVTSFTLSGYIGDTGIADANVIVTEKNGDYVATTKSNDNGFYEIDLPHSVSFPIILQTSGGTDIALQTPSNNNLSSFISEKKQSTVNINSFSTLLQLTEAATPFNSLNSNYIIEAISKHFHFSLNETLLPSPVYTEINGNNLENFLYTNVMLSETLLRTSDLLRENGIHLSKNEILAIFAKDISDGTFDGAGNSQTSQLVSSAFTILSGQVIFEFLNLDSTKPEADAIQSVRSTLSRLNLSRQQINSNMITSDLLSTANIASTAADLLMPNQFVSAIATLHQLTMDHTDTSRLALNLPGISEKFRDAANLLFAANENQLKSINDITARNSTNTSPIISFSASADSIIAGESVELSWSSLNANQCTASGLWLGKKEVSGIESSQVLYQSGQFNLSCSNLAGLVANQSININVKGSINDNLPSAPLYAEQLEIETISVNDSELTNGNVTEMSYLSDKNAGTKINLNGQHNQFKIDLGIEQEISNVKILYANTNAPNSLIAYTVSLSTDETLWTTAVERSPLKESPRWTEKPHRPETARYVIINFYNTTSYDSIYEISVFGRHISSVTKNDSVTLTWNQNNDIIHGYKVFYSNNESSSYTEIRDIPILTLGDNLGHPQTTFDKMLDLGITVEENTCFQVRAYNNSGLSEPSDTLCTII